LPGENTGPYSVGNVWGEWRVIEGHWHGVRGKKGCWRRVVKLQGVLIALPLHMPLLLSSGRTNARTSAFTAAWDGLHASVEMAHRRY